MWRPLFLLLLKLLGWKAALTGSKATSFVEAFTSLGIGYILPRTPGGFVRELEVASTCVRALQTGVLSPAECVAFAGRLRWLDTQIFGRQGRWAFRVILEHGTRPGRNRRLQLTPALKDAFSWVLDNVPKAEPRAFRTPAASSRSSQTALSSEAQEGRCTPQPHWPNNRLVSGHSPARRRTVPGSSLTPCC